MPSDQLEDYKKWLAQEPRVGDKYVIIDAKWFEHWRRFVGLEKSDEAEVTDPGPMDFTQLTDSSLSANVNEIQLRADALEGNDYTFIPYELFKSLLGTHKKIGPEIVRKAIPQGDCQTVIESFLVPLRICSSKFAHSRAKQIYRSRRTKIDDIKKDICSEFSISLSSNYRLYTSTDENGTSWEMIDERSGSVLEDIDLMKNAYITYELKTIATRSASPLYSSSKGSYTRGLCGLSNLGNTCFMNSALQCLSNVPELTNYFLTDEYKGHINRDNPLGMKGDVAHTYGELIHDMWSGRNSHCAPKSLKNSVAHYAPQFSGYAQQDSQEFMSFLLDGLHEDLNRVKQKPYIEKIDDDGKFDDEILANAQWEWYGKRNQSKILDIFHGQIKSVVQCLTCGTKGRTFDPICFLSLPLPNKTKIRTFKIDYIRLNGKIKTYTIKSNEHGRMNNLIQDFCDRFQPKTQIVDEAEAMDTDDADQDEKQVEDFTKDSDYDGHQPRTDYILAAEIYNHRIHTQYGDNYLLTSIVDRDQIVFYETPDSLKKGTHGNILMPCVFRESNTRQNFALPIYLTVPRQKCTGKDIQDALQSRIGTFFPLSASDSSDKTPSYTASCSLSRNYQQQTKLLTSLLDEHIDFNQTNTSLIVDVSSAVVDKYKEQEEENRKEKERLSLIAFNENKMQTNNKPERLTTLLECFKYFTTKETLSEDDLWNCPKCKKLERATKKFDLWRLPKVLIIQLKRFQYTRYFRDKISLLIDCPLRDLDLSNFVLNPSEKANAKYNLIAVSNHMGSLGGGHYTAHAKNHHDQKWHTFDDSYVSDVNEESVIGKAAYVLIYEQQTQSNGDENVNKTKR